MLLELLGSIRDFDSGSRIAKESINLSYVDDSLIRAQFLFLPKFLDFEVGIHYP